MTNNILSKSILYKNIELLKKNKYNLNAVKKLTEYKCSQSRYQLKKTKNNLFSVMHNNKPLTSLYNPIEEAKRLIQQFAADNKEHIGIFLSIASFYHIQYFLSLNNKNKALIIEKDIEIAKLILENIEIEENNSENIIIILSEDTEAVSSFFNFYINDSDAEKIACIRHVRASNTDKEAGEYYSSINICILECIKEKLMSLTSNYYFAPIWSRNILYNMHFNKGYSIKTFHNILNKSIPILLVSAGASIDSYIEQIAELSETHFIIVLSHAFNTLIQNNIKPNAVVSTDGGFYSSIHTADLIKKENKDINIFTTHSAYPFPLTNIENNRIFYFSHNESFEKILYPIEESSGNIYFCMEGSVIMPALRIACMLNPKYILLAGCDFCHIDDKTHSKFSNATAYDMLKMNKLKTFESLKYKRLNDNQKVKCYDNIYRNTSDSLLSYKNHFENLICKIPHNTDIFTLTKESAALKNTSIYDDKLMHGNKRFKIEIKRYLEEDINKNSLIKKLNEYIKNINNNDASSDLTDIISPWHAKKLLSSSITYEEFKNYINKWYNDIKPLLN